MDETYSESDVSLSPSQILERLQVLRQLQLMQRGKLQKQRLEYNQNSETSSSITEIVGHFSNTTSYNTFRSLLQSSNDISIEGTPRTNGTEISPKVQERDLIDGVSVLNLSQESEFIVNSPVSSRSRTSAPSRNLGELPSEPSQNTSNKTSVNSSLNKNPQVKKQISLDEMPILSPKKDFEALLIEKLQSEKSAPKPKSPNKDHSVITNKKRPFLRRGEGIARFGLRKNDFVIQNTKSLPWKRKSFQNKTESPLKLNLKKLKEKNNDVPKEKTSNAQNKKSDNVQSDLKKVEKDDVVTSEPSLLVTDIHQAKLVRKNQSKPRLSDKNDDPEVITRKVPEIKPTTVEPSTPINRNIQHINKPLERPEFPKNKHPLVANKGKSWAAVLTQEQNDFLSQLKQSDYYKNFVSPSKSVISDASCDETMTKLRYEREAAEQNMFELLENKVTHDSFSLENSFFDRFLRSNLESSTESTPLILQKCLARNPNLINILPGLKGRVRNENSHSDAETCSSNCSDCSDACSSCCSCRNVDQSNYSGKKSPQNHNEHNNKNAKSIQPKRKAVQINHQKEDESKECHDDTMTETDVMKTNMAEMNAKLISTSELLKDRLCELEDEIATFKKENANLAKLREEVDQDRQKFYEEKAAFEQKFNEEKVLSEYYLAEEKEKLNKQKQMYERYVREMRGRLNKKDKDEVVNLKKEINDLKEEIRVKDAKSTSTIARLRNQIKIMEKERKDLQEEVEKLKKQNKRIQHSNEVTRRLTNIKYLEEINKKLTNMSNKDSRSEVSEDRDIKYKAYEIERQSRSRRVEPVGKSTIRPRAKSVPNLNVTSRYAKYFSQRDTLSQIEQNKLPNVERIDYSDEENEERDNDTISNESLDDDDRNEDSNNLEKIYIERFKSSSPKSARSSGSSLNFELNLNEKPNLNDNAKSFFIQKSSSGSSRTSKSPRRTISPCFNANETVINRAKSPISILSNKSSKSPPSRNSTEYLSSRSGSIATQNRSKSPVSSYNHSSMKSVTVIHNEQYRDKLMNLSPEPSISRTSLSKTSLNPTEVKKPDGSKELRFPNGNVKYISADGKYSKFVYYNGDVKENFYSDGRIKYFYAETKTYHTTHADGLEVLEFPDGQVEKRYKDGSSEIRLPNGSVRYFDPKNEHVREEWRFPDGAALTVSASGEQRIVFSNGQVEVHAKDHKRREFPDGTVKLVYNDGTSETRYASGRVRIKDKHGNLIMDSAPG
ncbi:unnamed protein product [Spodoptera littoralis]|uniref:Centromere protein J n=1 Tax=Spodoptera littoralis TaxID=7109 RepID=A0A9P0I6N4_SPOLI|nr:unnamed protein product [Spodoptera littoralis]CAH1641135.1 unnamed protein product [Spodoptera littoralis]